MNKMEHTDLIGGVSPLKKVVKAKRSGQYGREATVTAKQRGGYDKVTSATNRGGYNVNTRFKARGEWQKPTSGGTTYIPTTAQKIIGDPLSGTEYRTLEGEIAIKCKGTFDEVWEAN